LLHHEGVSVCQGLYFLGFPWMRSRKSPILFGIIEDAEFIGDKISEYIKKDIASNISM
jgi:putative flavoprotein involved in K+ transport